MSQKGAEKADHSIVGTHFVNLYYSKLTVSPTELHLFYQEQSVFSHGHENKGPATVFVGPENIREKIASLHYLDSSVSISVIDVLPSHDGGILVLVMGFLVLKNQRPKKFAETFFLVNNPNGYSVLNHIFRFIDEDSLEFLSQENEATEEPSEAKPQEVSHAEVEQPKQEEARPALNAEPVASETAAVPSPAVPAAAAPAASSPAVPATPPPTPNVAAKPATAPASAPVPVASDSAPAPAAESPVANSNQKSSAPKTAGNSEAPKAEGEVKDKKEAKREATPKKEKTEAKGEGKSDTKSESKGDHVKSEQKNEKETNGNGQQSKAAAPKSNSWASIAAKTIENNAQEAPVVAPKPQAAPAPRPAQAAAPPKPAPAATNGEAKPKGRPDGPRDHAPRDNTPRDNTPKSLYISNIPFSSTVEDLQEIFVKFGPIRNIDLRIQKGFGFIEYVDVSHGHAAIESAKNNPINMKNRQLGVEERRPFAAKGGQTPRGRPKGQGTAQ